MTLLYCHRCFLNHETGGHPERADRIRHLPERLAQAGLAEQCRTPEFEPAKRQWVARVHSPSYIDEVWAYAKSGGGYIDPDTVVSPASYDVALMAAGCVCDAVDRLVRGEDTQAMCLVRPPGHHAMPGPRDGLLPVQQRRDRRTTRHRFLGHRARADRRLGHPSRQRHPGDVLGRSAGRILFDPSLAVLSRHGRRRRDGRRPGNLAQRSIWPVEYGTPRKDYLDRFADNLEKFAAKMKPQLVFINAGYDTHRLDPVGDLGLETEDYIPLTNHVLDVAATYAEGRVVSVLEGGYDPDILADCVGLHLAEMLKRRKI